MNLRKDAFVSLASQVTTLNELPEAHAYLIRILTYQQQPLLGHLHNGQLSLNDNGTIVADEWIRSANSRRGLELDSWTILPHEIQGIVILEATSLPISSPVLAGALSGQKPWILSSFIASFKAAAAKRINLRRNQLGETVWQRNYQEQFIPDVATLNLWRNHLREKVQ